MILSDNGGKAKKPSPNPNTLTLTQTLKLTLNLNPKLNQLYPFLSLNFDHGREYGNAMLYFGYIAPTLCSMRI